MNTRPFSSPQNLILDRERSLTNFPTLFTLVISIALWIPTIVYAYSAGGPVNILSPEIIEELEACCKISALFAIILMILSSSLLCGLALIAFRWIPNILYLLYFFVLYTLIRHFICLIINQNFNFGCIYSTINIVSNYLLFMILKRAEWFHLPEKILKECCKIIIQIPVLLIFAGMCYFSVCLLFVVGFTVHLHLKTLELSNFRGALMFINIFTALWLSTSVILLQTMVISGTFAAWFWTERKEEITSAILLRCLQFSIRNHLGTIAQLASFGVLQMLYLTLDRIFLECKKGCNIKLFFFVIYYFLNFQWLCMVILLCAGIRCAINGNELYESATDCCDIFVRHTKRCLNVITMLFYSNHLVYRTMILVYGFIVKVLFASFSIKVSLAIHLPTILIGSAVFLYVLCVTIFIGSLTILFCFLDDVDGDTRPYAMSPELNSILNHDGPPIWYRNIRNCCGLLPS